MNSDQPPVKRTLRLFLALWPDDDLRHQISLHSRQWTWPPSCVQYLPADWHVTLHFIGNVDADRVADIAAHLELPLQPIELVLDQPRMWPHGLAVLCANERPVPLLALHECLGDTLRSLDLPVETRPYVPHVTLARHAEAAIVSKNPAPVLWQAQSYALVVSTGNKDQRYRVIRRYQ